jgi:hypothetical protein
MKSVTKAQHIQRLTLHLLIVFVAFAATRFVLIEKVRSEPYRDYHRILVTDFAVDGLAARWGLDLLVVPIVAVGIAIMRRWQIGDVLVAFALALSLAICMAYFPSSVMSGHLRWARISGDYMVLSFTYAIAIVVALVVVNRVAARIVTAEGTRTTP